MSPLPGISAEDADGGLEVCEVALSAPAHADVVDGERAAGGVVDAVVVGERQVALDTEADRVNAALRQPGEKRRDIDRRRPAPGKASTSVATNSATRGATDSAPKSTRKGCSHASVAHTAAKRSMVGAWGGRAFATASEARGSGEGSGK